MQRQNDGRAAGIVGNRPVMAAVSQRVRHGAMGRSSWQTASQFALNRGSQLLRVELLEAGHGVFNLGAR